MKSKISTILAGEVPDDNDYVRVVTKLPEIIDDHNFNQARFPRKSASAQEVKLAAQIRAAAKKYQWADWKLQRNSQEQQSGRSLSQYGYYVDKTGHNSGTDDVDMDEYERSEDEDEELDDANEESRRYLRPLTDGRVADVMRELQNVRYSDYSDGQGYEDYEGSEDAAQQSTGAAEMSDGISD